MSRSPGPPPGDGASIRVGILLTLLAAVLVACGESRPTPSPSPTPRTGPAPAPAPAPDPEPAPGPPVTVSGVVYEHVESGRRPLPGLSFKALTSRSDIETVDVTSDSQGRFRFRAPAGRQVAIVLVPGSGYHAPCPAGFDRLESNAALSIHVVADATLSTTGMPASLPTWVPRISGVVSVSDGAERSPVAGAVVELAGEPESPLKSVTLTDAHGRYMLCTNPPGTGTNQVAWVTAWKGDSGALYASQSISLTGDDRVPLELGGYWDY